MLLFSVPGFLSGKEDKTKQKKEKPSSYKELSDEELVPYIAEKDEKAFETVVERYEKFVFSSVRCELRSDEDAFDVSQEVFIRLYGAAGGFRCESTLKTWLYRMCKNCAVDFCRKNYKHGFLSLTKHGDDENGEGEADIPDTNTPEEEILRREKIRTVRQAVASLPEQQRSVIELREFGDMAYSDIAKTLGISEGTVKSRIARAREALKILLADKI